MKAKKLEDDNITRKLQQDGIETNGTLGQQFILNQTLGECLREIQRLMDKWELRPLEKDILIMLLNKFEGDKRMAEKSKALMGGTGSIIKKIMGDMK